MRHFLSVSDLGAAELAALLDRAAACKRDPQSARLARAPVAALLFAGPSLRTRTAYEIALMHLGGRTVMFDTPSPHRDTVADVARTLSQLVSAIVARVRDHALIEALADAAEIPVINALSSREHPVEVLADVMTLHEQWGKLAGRRLVYLGDGNNICSSLLLLAPPAGLHFVAATPATHAPPADIVERARQLASENGTSLDVLTDPRMAVAGADAVYTDVWASRRPEESFDDHLRTFSPFQVNAELMALADPGAVILHCLPARRGEEITARVLEGSQSLAFHRLSNLVPVTMAVLSWLLE